MKLSVLMNDKINQNWFEKMLEMDRRIFPAEGNDYLEPDYIRSLYKQVKEGLFFCVDEDVNRLAGYFTVIFLDEKQRDEYLNGSHFSTLLNKGMKKGKNILYLYTLAVEEDYRGTACMKLMGKAFARWLDTKIQEGYEVSEVYAEAVSEDGARSLKNGFGMTPMRGADEKGIGHYVSDDQLNSYIIKML